MDSPIPVDLGRIAQDLQIRRVQVESIVQLLDEGCTVPFIARYRRDRTAGLRESVIREVRARIHRARELNERKLTILKAIENQNRLTDELAAAIRAADSPKRLDDLYLPFKPKKRTKGLEAREAGLEPLAVRIWERDETLTNLQAAAAELVNPEKGLDSPEKVLEGVSHILSESISELANVRETLRRVLWRAGKLVTQKNETLPEGKGLDFRDYFRYSEPVSHVPAHRILAINRGERENTLKVKLEVPRAELERAILGELPLDDHPHKEFFTAATLDALDHHLLPALEKELKRDLTDLAERHAVDVFARNLRRLLLQPATTGKVVLAIDPGRKGCKVAVINPEGNLLDHAVVQPFQAPIKRHEAKQKIKDLVLQHGVHLVAIGNGSACRETEEFIAEIIAEGTHFHTNPGVPFPSPPPRPPRGKPGQTSPESPRDSAQTANGQTITSSHASASEDDQPSLQTPPAPETHASPVDPAHAPHQSDHPPVETQSADSTPQPDSTWPEPTPSKPAAEPHNHLPTPPSTDQSTENAADDTPLPPIAGGSDDTGDTEQSMPAGPFDPNQLDNSSGPVPQTPTAEPHAEAPSSEQVDPPSHAPPDAAVEPSLEALTEPANLAPHDQPATGGNDEPTSPQPAEMPPSASPQATEPPTDSAAPTEPATPPREPVPTPLTQPPRGSTKSKPDREPKPPKPKIPVPPPAPHPADELLSSLAYLIVNEAGASVYSASTLASEELPDHDNELRGTISIGRRLQDPLAELVKIEPQNIGVGQYQHDVNPKQLKQTLDEVVESCVNLVGVDLNRANVTMLSKVSGLNELLARRILEFRKQHGPFTSREQLKQVEGITDAIFTQCAGFMKLPEGENPLDRTWVHPDQYEIARTFLEQLGFAPDIITTEEGLRQLRARFDELDIPAKAKELDISAAALGDLMDALAQPGFDPRDDFPKPIFKRGLLKLEDLKPGMELKGTVLNVVDFGAFIDIGLKDSGLVHISQLANRYIKSPHDVVSVGDVVTAWVLTVDGDRKRVSLTMIEPGSDRPRGGERPSRPGPGGHPSPGGSNQPHGAAKRGPRPPQKRNGGPARGGPGSDRGPNPTGQNPSSQAETAESKPATPRPGTNRIPGPPLRLQQQGRGGRPGQGRGTPGRGTGRNQAGPRPESADTEKPAAPKPKPQNQPPAPLSKDALSGSSPLRSFGQLKQFLELRNKVEESPDTATSDPTSASPAPSGADDASAAPPPPETPTGE